jgi:antitoxin MazE
VRVEITPRLFLNELYVKLSRNDNCFCGSGKKFKKCCIDKKYHQGEHFQLIAKKTIYEPAGVTRDAHLHVDQRVRVCVDEGRLVITPVEDAPLTLEQRLALFDPAQHGGEVMATDEPLGAEKW